MKKETVLKYALMLIFGFATLMMIPDAELMAQPGTCWDGAAMYRDAIQQGMDVEFYGDYMVFTISDGTTVHFKNNSAILSSAAEAKLRRIANLLVTYGGDVTIAGHTNSIGSNRDNELLSKARAESVENFLSSIVPASWYVQYSVLYYGETRLRYDESTAAGLAGNRRVELTVKATTGFVYCGATYVEPLPAPEPQPEPQPQCEDCGGKDLYDD